jgi:hypothetical protein
LRVRHWVEAFLLFVASAAIACFGARPFAGSWNDGSRLATVESLVDHQTWAIDDSIFVKVPKLADESHPHPYSRDMSDPVGGTFDRIQIGGRFYSHQPPVPALLLACVYGGWRSVTGATARDRPDEFCRLMAITASGTPYVITMLSIYLLAIQFGLTPFVRVMLPLSFSMSTIALAYTRNVNNHVMLLATVAVLGNCLVALAHRAPEMKGAGALLSGCGLLSGLGFAMDQAAGLPLVAFTLGLVLWRNRSVGAFALFLAGSSPILATHFALNYSIGGTIRPYGSVPEHFNWQGSAFNAQNMTGVYNHPSVADLVSYAFDLLFGSRGFLIHNPTLLLAFLGGLFLVRKPFDEFPEFAWAVSWCVATWAIYAVFSTNYAGQCLSIRWFIPLIAPGYMVLAIYMKHFPRHAWALAAVSVYSAYFALDSWQRGPWHTA